MADPGRDRWAEWFLERRFGGDQEHRASFLQGIIPWRDWMLKMLKNAAIENGETLLDVGAKDGLLAFGALELVGEDGRVVFSDISRDLRAHSRNLAERSDVLERYDFSLAPADDLSALQDASVDVVTTRSVLIYVDDKRRVLKPGGRL